MVLKKFDSGKIAIVDGEVWYTIRTNNTEVARCIRKHPRQYWYQHPNYCTGTGRRDELFDVHEQIYTMLSLTFL